MFNVVILVPVYYNEEAVAECLMQLTRCNYENIKPTLFIPVTGIRESFIDSFLSSYVEKYSKASDSSIYAMFEDIIPVFDDSSFDPSIMMNDIVSDHDEFEYISIVEPQVQFESFNWLLDLISIDTNYDHIRGLGAICTNNKTHTMKTSDKIKWTVGDQDVIRSLDGGGFGNGIMLTTRVVWETVGGFTNKEYTNTFAISCFRNGHLVVYAEDVR